ncbi:sensor histidine kinase [Myceligenerans crystallogenes]|uniref:histidine kinase n=1 Tax=Myceligenerans crystallogenes TaxID=316335 RepID=A0ABP4ZCL6_9MICO
MIRTFVRRFAWAMLGAAIGLAVALVVYFGLAWILSGRLTAPVGEDPPGAAVAGVSLACALALGLVPGTRELEVTAARSLLGADAELVVPARETWGHRLRTAVWIAFHLVTGLLVAFCLFGLIPATIVIGTESVLGHTLGTRVPVPDVAAARVAVVLACVAGGVAAALGAWPAGALARRAAAWLLGPTTADRLEVALARQRREAEHTLLARELHDGIGHALTIVSVQAAAGRRVAATRPERAAEAFVAIEEVSRGALAELDALLGILRDDRAAAPAGGVADVVEQHRRAGLEVAADVALPADLPPILRRTVARIVTEGLTNARRHGAPGEVRLRVGHTDHEVFVQVSNAVSDQARVAGPGPAGAAARPSGRDGGRGLAGIRERAALFGGSAAAGVVGHDDGVRRHAAGAAGKDEGAGPSRTGGPPARDQARAGQDGAGFADDDGRWLLSVRLPRITAGKERDE